MPTMMKRPKFTSPNAPEMEMEMQEVEVTVATEETLPEPEPEPESSASLSASQQQPEQTESQQDQQAEATTLPSEHIAAATGEGDAQHDQTLAADLAKDAARPYTETLPPLGELLQYPKRKIDWDKYASSLASHEAVVNFECEKEDVEERYIEASIERAKLEIALKSAKKSEKDILEELSNLIDRGPQENVKPKLPKPPRAAGEATDVAADGNAETSDEPAAVESDAWRAADIDQLDLKPALVERLREGGIDTIGQLEDLRGKVADHAGEWPKGIGKAKITQIEDAVIGWLTKHRDSGLFGGGKVSLDVEGDAAAVESAIEYPTPEQWGEWTDDQQTAWLNARAVQLDSDDLDTLTSRQAEGCDDFFADGVEAYDQGDLIVNCDHPPGPECDAWLLGWLWQGKQDEGGETAEE
jgi:hypothetical protein